MFYPRMGAELKDRRSVIKTGFPGIPNSGAQAAYVDELIDTYNADVVWPLVDIEAGNTITASPLTTFNGTLTGWTLQSQASPVDRDTLRAPLSDGLNDFGDVDTAALVAAFDGDEGSIFCWARVSGAGVWSDGVSRRILTWQVNASNRILFNKLAAANTLSAIYTAGGVNEPTNITLSPTDWFSLGISWSASDDEVKVYLDGAQTGITRTVLGVWAGALAIAFLGSSSAVPANVWDGNLAYFAAKFGSIWTAADFAGMHANASA